MLKNRLRRALLASLFAWPALVPSLARAQAPAAAPAEIKIGHLHAGSGAFASISMPVYLGLKLWVDQTNASGGAFVKAYNKKIPLRLIDYDDQSSTATAATLYDQLITQDKVDILVADSGSVLTSVAVPIAKEHKMFLFDPTGTGASFFVDNPWIALMADPASTVWPRYVGEFLNDVAAKQGIKRVALLYSTNDFTGTQATTIRNAVKASKTGLQLVYDQGVPTNTSNYTTLIGNIAAANPDAVLELGYVGNDIAFLRNLQDSGESFKLLFALYPGIEKDELTKNVGPQGLNGVFTYVTSAEFEYTPNVGMTAEQYRAAWHKAYPDAKVEFGFNSIAGYTSGLVLEQTLANADSLDQTALRKAVFSLSGKMKTLDGPFALDETGAQVGELMPIGQLKPDGKGGTTLTPVYPPDVAKGQPVFGGQ